MNDYFAPMLSPVSLFLAAAISALGFGALLSAEAAAAEVSFSREIRPILSNNCFSCHGPDEKTRDADLRLDTRAGATADLGGYSAIVPGKPDASELLTRILSHDKDEVMPPPKVKKPRLTEKQIAALRQWIAEGARYESHWAFLPLGEEAPPGVKHAAWIKNEIDHFILARLEQEGIDPSPEADRATLLRRASLDLTGLPPTPEETLAFLEDSTPDAYGRLVDRLLASPHHGERWGRHWLDQARYADSNGYTVDTEREMWPFRDWVIRALNEDMPFDRFSVEQLAGDLLPGATKSQLIASAFHRNTLINQEGGADPEQFRVEATVDRVNTTGAVWLGLTVGCAQCHTHKFDPIPHREYFRLFAFFNAASDKNNKGATVRVLPGEILPAAQPAVTPEAWENGELERLSKRPPSVASAPSAFAWKPVELLEFGTSSGAGFEKLPDNSLLSDGRGAPHETYRVKFRAGTQHIAALRLRTLTHESLPKGGPGRAPNGNFVLTKVELLRNGEAVALASAQADHEQADYPVSGVLDDDPRSGWAINAGAGSKAQLNADHEAVFTLASALDTTDGPLEVRLFHERNGTYLIGRFALEVAEVVPSAPSDDALLTALKTSADQRTPEQRERISTAYAKGVEEQRIKAEAELMVMRDLEKPRPTFLLQRGDFTRPDTAAGELAPGVLSAVNAAFQHSQTEFRTRLDLARWLVSPENPLTPRVTVNRVWMRYFGRGLVETEDDFGTQGTPPTHPELLDWLGRRFMQDGWSLKKLHRLIVTSATYRQSSNARPDLVEKDPRNLLLARQERLRLEAEIVRDAALCASGLLDRTLGGPPVRPPQPEGVYAFTQSANKWDADTGPERFRRALYTRFYRSAPYPLFSTFDAPDFQLTCTRRPRSNTPLQALTLANDIAFLEMARGFAAQLAREDSDAAAGECITKRRIRRAFLLGLCRHPSEAELATLSDFAIRQAARFAENPMEAAALAPQPFAGLSAADSAALVNVARALFNTDNFIARE